MGGELECVQKDIVPLSEIFNEVRNKILCFWLVFLPSDLFPQVFILPHDQQMEYSLQNSMGDVIPPIFIQVFLK